MSIFKKVSVTIKGPVVDNGVDEREFIFDPNDRKSISIASDHIWGFVHTATYAYEDISVEEIEGALAAVVTGKDVVSVDLDEVTMTFKSVGQV